MLRVITWISLMSLPCWLAAQSLAEENDDYLRRGFFWGLHASSNGVGVGLRYELGDGAVAPIWTAGLDLYIVRDPHEVRIEPIREQGRRYIFNKQNHFLVLSPMVGRQITLAPRTFLNQIGLHGGVQVGPAIGILNPYYLEICQESSPGSLTCTREIEAFDPALHAFGRILGRAPLVSTRITPTFRLGLNIQAYATLDFTTSRRIISGVNIGFHVRAFPSRIPILVESEDLQNQSIFVSGSVGFLLGNRW